jgi:putative restriction endonuclease
MQSSGGSLRHDQVMRPLAEQRAIREDIFRWLDEAFVQRGGYEIDRETLLGYTYRGERIPLLDTGRGIRNPADFSSTLTLMSGWKANQYSDYEDDSGWITYSYQERDGGDNKKLIRACEDGERLVYFRAVRAGFYIAYYPVVASNDPVRREVSFPLDTALQFLGDPLALTSDQRRYAETIVKVRLHQPIFRAKVLHAYASSCTVCDLRHPELLDAAHIESDSSEFGVPHVTNGMAMCKLHHAAYDRALMGITPDFEVRIDKDLLSEVDGPMLRHGLQDMHGHHIRLPEKKASQPSRDRLAQRFELFGQR